MTRMKLLSFEYFPTFQNKEEFYQNLLSDKKPWKKIVSLYILIILLSFFYGAVMGCYTSFIQTIAAGIKVPILFSVVLIICFPAFFIIQYILGSKLSLVQIISILFSGFVLTTAIMVSFTPIVIFFILTGGNYYFLQLLHIAIFILSGIFGMRTVIEALRFACENQNLYPKIGVEIFRFWVIIMAFVGIQLAWNLRPFLGDRNEPFKLFRHYEGNFYAAVIYSIDQLMNGKDKTNNNPYNKNQNKTINDSSKTFFRILK